MSPVPANNPSTRSSSRTVEAALTRGPPWRPACGRGAGFCRLPPATSWRSVPSTYNPAPRRPGPLLVRPSTLAWQRVLEGLGSRLRVCGPRISGRGRSSEALRRGQRPRFPAGPRPSGVCRRADGFRHPRPRPHVGGYRHPREISAPGLSDDLPLSRSFVLSPVQHLGAEMPAPFVDQSKAPRAFSDFFDPRDLPRRAPRPLALARAAPRCRPWPPPYFRVLGPL